jgi:hypothetical protein
MWNLTSAGPFETFTQMLPATLTDANWGMKATVCAQGGYDIQPLAGHTICLAGEDISQTCSGQPLRAWVLMSDGVVMCVYEAGRPGSASTNGLYPAGPCQNP